MDELFTLLEQLQQLAVERFLINASTASLEEAKISSSKLNQRLFRATNQPDAVSLTGSLDSIPSIPVTGSSESLIRRVSASSSPFTPSPYSASSPAIPSSSSSSTFPSIPSRVSSTPLAASSFSFSDIQSALNAASTDPYLSSSTTGSAATTPRSHAQVNLDSRSASSSSDFEAIEEDFFVVPGGGTGGVEYTQVSTPRAVGGGGLDAGTPILSATDLLVAKTRNEQLHNLFKLPAEEKLLMGT